MNLNDVYKKIENNNIKVFSFGISETKAVSIQVDDKYGIFINHKEIKSKDEEFIIATHEYGHCMTGSTHHLNSPLDLIMKHEYKADRCAVLDFLPVERLKDAINHGCQTVYEFSEYLEVPEQFIIKAFRHYNAMNLI